MKYIILSHRFIDNIFKYNDFHYHDGESLLSLYSVTLLVDLPRKNLTTGRKFYHVLWDFDNHCLKIYYKNNKSCGIDFNEFNLII